MTRDFNAGLIVTESNINRQPHGSRAKVSRTLSRRSLNV